MGSKEDKQIHGLARFSVPRLLYYELVDSKGVQDAN